MDLEFEDYQVPYQKLNGASEFRLGLLKLCRCTMQVGYIRRADYLVSSSLKSIGLFLMVIDNVIQKRDGSLQLSSNFYKLDQSEKCGVSYQLGQGLTKAVAEEYFDIPWLGHFNAIKQAGYGFIPDSIIKKNVAPVKNVGGKKPDLVGYDLYKRVHLFESKGFSSKPMSNAKIQKAINQVSHYKGISDTKGKVQYFTTRNACLFNYEDRFRGRIIDPANGEDRDYTGNVGFLEFIYRYYSLFLNADEKEMDILSSERKDWIGYYFSFQKQRFFWGMERGCWEYLKRKFGQLDLKKLIAGRIEDEIYEKQTQLILYFFAKYFLDEKEFEKEFNSKGKDRMILSILY